MSVTQVQLEWLDLYQCATVEGDEVPIHAYYPDYTYTLSQCDQRDQRRVVVNVGRDRCNRYDEIADPQYVLPIHHDPHYLPP